MATAVSVVIENMKTRLPFWSPQVAGPTALLSLIAEVQRTLVLRTIATNAAYLSAMAAVSGPFVPLTNVTMPANHALLHVLGVLTTGEEVPVEILPSAYRGVYVNGLALYPLGETTAVPMGETTRWADVASLRVFYTAQAAQSIANTSVNLVLPDFALDAVVTALNVAIGYRAVLAGLLPPSESGAMMATLRQQAADAEGDYLDRVRGRGIARVLRDTVVI